ncbi:hypothetical protein RR48_15344 [Papilio machaon]|uniref:Uncharacterized protein n=1 Tax=Papilio machaon TaxID=76193 RepID=A0A194QUJ8_PAPMA|nr:hypothetical protein RR48_15344 [Papilio machaon]
MGAPAQRGFKTGRASTRWKLVLDGCVPFCVVSDVAACWLRVLCCGACALARSGRRLPSGRIEYTTPCPRDTSTRNSLRERACHMARKREPFSVIVSAMRWAIVFSLPHIILIN